MVWFLLFSIVPLAFITMYSLIKYEDAIDQEVENRLKGNVRETALIFDEFRLSMQDLLKRYRRDSQLIYRLHKGQHEATRQLASSWLANSFLHRLKVFNRDGTLIVSLFKDEKGQVQRKENHESSGLALNEDFAGKADKQDFIHILDFYKGDRLELVMFSAVKTAKQRVVGYIEESLIVDSSFLAKLGNRLGIEIAVFTPGEKDKAFASHDDWNHYASNFFNSQWKKYGNSIMQLNIQDVPYGVVIKSLDWGEAKLNLAVGSSKKAINEVFSKVRTAFITVIWTVVVLLIILSLVMSKVLLKPLSEMVQAIQRMNPVSGEHIEVPVTSQTELGTLAQAFNSMSVRIHESQKNLQSKVEELERANQEIRETQAKLVHTAKMASLGQLVAGVAHELNNPIGFIYSNMTHLKDYTSRLIRLVDIAEKEPKKLKVEKEEAEFDYIVEDMPKLIHSCEDGARRTRDIVLGLRNFSRLEEAKLKTVDVHEGIDTTLRLLSGELKGRVKVKKKYGDIPLIECYPSQLNQVFMNILSNAAHAIGDQGEIRITTNLCVGKTDCIDISICDNGKGMTEETAEKIFDPFFTTKSVGSGTGLGMSISYGIIQNHNGDIRVHSKLNEGTEFIITLPLKQA
ncbi:MAG: HAMP domain-containing protein [Bdellovibrionales bacterium]|nr:HAMP domain-containing protein [Bdellovibrionales bacterium]